MEKQRSSKFIKSGRRFLTIFLLAINSGFLNAQTVSLEQINSLKITPAAGQELYTKTDIKFTVTLPNVRSSQLHIISTEQQADISFRTIRKSENYETNGTTIEIWYNFENKGSYNLKPISVMIQNRRRNIHFEPVTVNDDPATLYPRMVIVFEDGTKVYSDEVYSDSPVLKARTGKKLHFTVNVQYANQMIQFNWEIPKDSIFSCTKEYDITEPRHRERIYSHNLIPVADFEWTGLVPGLQRLPYIRINATGYNGYRSELYMPELQIEFTQPGTSEDEITETDIFSSAFYQESVIENNSVNVALTREECQTLANLYTREHNEFLMYTKARKSRIAFETEHGLVVSANPIFPTVLLYIALIVILLSIIFIIISSRKKHRIQSLIFTTFLLLGIAVLIYCSVRRNERYGISSGCKTYSIPQENSESVSEIASGIKVHILERTEKWYYIEVGESGGWCAAEDIFIIK